MHLVRTLAFAAMALGAQTASASCYYVYSSTHQMLYRSQVPPVDLAKPLHETVPALGPGLSLVFTANDSNCSGTLDMLQSYRSSKAATKVKPRKR